MLLVFLGESIVKIVWELVVAVGVWFAEAMKAKSFEEFQGENGRISFWNA